MTIAGLCGLIIFVLLAVMLIAGVPIAVALAVSSICAILPVLNMGASVLTGAQRIFSGISVFSLLAIPFFILAGNLMNKGGIAIRLINFAKLFTGNIPGALAHTNAVANMLFGAISGSGTAAASAMGSIIGPIEEEEGYDRDFSAAANIATAPTGLLIPPSNVMITFSLVSGGTSVAALFMAGYIPGILWGLACMVVIYIFAKKKGYRSTKKYTSSEKIRVFLQAIPCLFMIIVVIGGIISGIFTATEGSVVAVVYSMVLAIFFYKSIKPSELPKIFLDSAEMTGIIIFLIGVSSICLLYTSSVPAYLQCSRQHHRRSFCGKRGTGSCRYLQSYHNTDDLIFKWSVHGCQYFNGNAVWGKRDVYKRQVCESANIREGPCRLPVRQRHGPSPSGNFKLQAMI